jgi:hypothetical protein
MFRYIVTLKCGQGKRSLSVDAPDEWIARQLAIRRNVNEGGPAMWVSQVSVGRALV